MSILKKICRIADTFNDVVCRLFGFLIVGVVAVIMCEVILRRFFGMPQIWTTDLITMFFGCYTILVLPLGLQHGTFVRVDLLVERLRPITAHWLQVITSIFFQIPFAYYMAPRAFTFFLKSYTTNELGYSVWAPVLWPVKLCLFIGMVLLAIQIICELLKEICWIIAYYKGGRKEPEAVGSLSILVAKASGEGSNSCQ